MHTGNAIVIPVPGDQAADHEQHHAERPEKNTETLVGPCLDLDR